MNENTANTAHMNELLCLDWTSCRTFARSLHALTARRAYEKWIGAGCPNGTEMKDWLEAEGELDMELEVRGKAGLIHAPLE